MLTCEVIPEIDKVLSYVYNNPEDVTLSLKNKDVYVSSDIIGIVKVGTLIINIPETLVSLLRVKSWRIQKTSSFYTLNITVTV